MKILLFNDNPVVRKLVALSAQKTKDELSVVWSVDEIEESEFDLLIMDDALYTDETFASLKEYIRYRSALLMATRGNAVPAGFDNVINKPFLPTDLVDMFVQIQKKLESSAPAPEPEQTEAFEEEESFSINLEESFPDIAAQGEDDFEGDKWDDADMDLGELGDLEEEVPLTSILDQEEVEEVRGLLEDTENDELFDEEAITVGGIDESMIGQDDASADDEFDFSTLTAETETADLEEAEFDFDDLVGSLEEYSEDESAAASVPMLEEVDETGFEELLEDAMPSVADEVFGWDGAEPELMLSEEEKDEGIVSDEEMDENLFAALNEEVTEELKIDDFELEDLAAQIREAVDELAPEDLEMEMGDEAFDEEILDDLNLGGSEEAEEGEFDELDMLDEDELKRAIGEETEDEIDIRVGEGGHASLNVEALGEVIGKSVQMASGEQSVTHPAKSGGAEGVEAIQALLKALANEEIAKSLKGLNISININFGNDK